MKTEKTAPESLPSLAGKLFAIVVATFYNDMAAWLEDGALRGLRDCGIAGDAVQSVHVPGCFE